MLDISEHEYFRSQFLKNLEWRDGWIIEVSYQDELFFWDGNKLIDDIDHSSFYENFSDALKVSENIQIKYKCDTPKIKKALLSF